MTLFNYLTNNDLLFYGLFAGTAGFMVHKIISSYLNSFYVDKGIQTDALYEYSPAASNIQVQSPTTLTSLDTVTPISEYLSTGSTLQTTSEVGTQTISEAASTVTTVLPIPPINVEIVPNQDIINSRLNLSIDINPVNFTPSEIRQMELLNSSVDIIEAYIPIPELIDTANTITQFYPWF